MSIVNLMPLIERDDVWQEEGGIETDIYVEAKRVFASFATPFIDK